MQKLLDRLVSTYPPSTTVVMQAMIQEALTDSPALLRALGLDPDPLVYLVLAATWRLLHIPQYPFPAQRDTTLAMAAQPD